MPDNQPADGSGSVKRKRGRPRKTAPAEPSPAADQKSEKAGKSQETKGGNDPVCATEHIDDGSSNLNPPRKRGRPRKQQGLAVSEVDSYKHGKGENESPPKTKQQYNCIHCGVVKDYSQMSLHMLRDHYRVWTPSNPEGTVNLCRALKRCGKLVCKQCDKKFNSAQYYSHHIQWCGREDERAICPVCKTSQKAMWLHAHLVTHKRQERRKLEKDNNKKKSPLMSIESNGKRKRQAAERALAHLKDMDLVDENTVPAQKPKKENGDNYEEESMSSSADTDDNVDSDTSCETRRAFGKKDRFNLLKPFWLEAFSLTKDYYRIYAKTSVLPSFVPSLEMWKQLSESQAAHYLPLEMTSIKFEITHIQGKKRRNDGKVHQLKFGESYTTEGGGISYCGGAVWGLDWCPIPETYDQYLAVACHRDFDHVTMLDHSTNGPGVVQIWNLGTLNYSSTEVKDSRIEFVIAVDDGVIVNVKWCPLGGFINSRKNKHPERIGVLAVATSSGFIHIYSIPVPDMLRAEECNQQPNVYKVQPSQTLCQNFDSQPDSPCLCLSWSLASDTTKLAAGFGDGSISVWNVSSQMTLDSGGSVSGNSVLWPYLTFRAHPVPVSGVDFYPSSADLLVSCAYERNIKHWDLREPDQPLEFCQLRSKLQSVAWPPFFPITLTTSDQCYAVTSTATYCVESNDECMAFANLFLHDGCAWDLSYSRWINTVIACDVIGSVICMILPHFYSLKVQQKGLSRRKNNLLKVTPRRLSPADATEHSATADQVCTTRREPADDIPKDSSVREASEGAEVDAEKRSSKVSWQDTLKKYILEFGFFDKNASSEDVATKTEHAPGINEPQAQSINRVVFSPNIASCCWTACAGQAGLLCVKNMPYLDVNPQQLFK